ncbi:ATP-binding protein [Aequorivita todarodis]|uniref:tetratricopeptide repeat-containing sensor histidine kinase n=1 Tax=Aequorivita todarodis TaxID=2036821 RepID=UPI00234FD09F|nr:tetratricopeptide repeat-containing sensor histidine kinase [Aequorivita todarodis]MDC8001786.1 ATP-binding protein [Aequorivita todarodis]
MKNLPLSFLFFCLCLAFPGNAAKAQVKTDSIPYYYNLILNPHHSSDIPNGLKFYQHLKEKHLKEGKTYQAIQDLRMIAIGQNTIGNLYESEVSLVAALALIDKSSHRDTLTHSQLGLYNQLGNIYRLQFNYTKAIEAFNDALRFSKKQSDSITIINNKANIFKDRHDYKNALEQLMIAYNKKNIAKDPLTLALVLDNLGSVQAKLNDAEALNNLHAALDIRKRKDNLTGMYSSYKNLALYYFDRANKTQALYYADKAYETAKTINTPSFVQDALSLFIIIEENEKMIAYQTISDSIEKEKQLAQNKNAFIKYNLGNEKKKTADALLAREKEKNQKLVFIILGVVIALTAIFIYLMQRIKHKKEKIVQVHNTETRISKKVHDEVANDVYHLMAKIQGNATDSEELLDDLEKIYNKTRDISKENSAIEIQENFSGQLSDLLLSYQTEKVKIATRNISKVDWNTISEIKKTTIYRVLQELMTNMKKHSNATAVVLSFQKNNKKINIEYTDNGTGCELKNKNGLQNAENRIKTLNGTIIFESKPNKGFKAKISL